MIKVKNDKTKIKYFKSFNCMVFIVVQSIFAVTQNFNESHVIENVSFLKSKSF